ncbi:Hemolysin secretion protein D, chromosomal [Zhongshania aliphaticivorans]|uniref:Membrane fusion protein (MFP) family protein n=1 Tax=Zhongshania aliphaticivorans TaxID=1470434 RepID=A0A5S9NP20_9GAMM|nr:HlyD family type I secretion periplasmic adaptor subunit [Zhongshania aliphaticivorans]CAA0092104.1 Hemolysin secretion protein D, chromosomal [Zhongshania aliphaticivorans]CAA0109219.1 Hemolysin secretion protein D, chromosomal [Zhongshania aliphaticivorans]
MTSTEKKPDHNKNKVAEQLAFEKVGRLSVISLLGRDWVDRLFKPFFAGFSGFSRDWKISAEQVVNEQREIRARGLLYAVVITLILIVVWSAFASVDEVTRGEGKIIPSQQLQVVQAVDGGVVENIFVAEGDVVRAGDLLVRIDSTRFVASFQEGAVKMFALSAKIERLQALIAATPYEPQYDQELSPAQQQVASQELDYYKSSMDELQQRLLIAQEQHSQRLRELDETRARLNAVQQSYQMSSKELQVTLPLLQSGAVSEMDILRLERDLAAADGERNQVAAAMRQVEAGVQEAQARISEVELGMRNQWRAELSEATSTRSSLSKNVDGLADRVKFSEIRSPVNGTVQRVLYNTLGGVVQPGHSVIEIVPSDDRLMVEAKVAPKDIAFLRPGLPATIKLHAYDFSIYGGMSATLQHISADSITDEHDNTYYLVRAITTDAEEGSHFSVIPGMTVQLDIMTGKRTVLAYILKPLLRAKGNALSER